MTLANRQQLNKNPIAVSRLNFTESDFAYCDGVITIIAVCLSVSLSVSLRKNDYTESDVIYHRYSCDPKF